MAEQLILLGPYKDFESIKHLDENGVEFWNARDLMGFLGYLRWENFEVTIKKAKKACLQNGQIADDHFRDLTKMVKIYRSYYFADVSKMVVDNYFNQTVKMAGNS